MLNYIYVSINFCLPGCTHRTLEEDDDEEVEYDYDNDEHDFKILMMKLNMVMMQIISRLTMVMKDDAANHIKVDIDVAVTLAVLAELSCHPPNVPHLQVGISVLRVATPEYYKEILLL